VECGTVGQFAELTQVRHEKMEGCVTLVHRLHRNMQVFAWDLDVSVETETLFALRTLGRLLPKPI
jgi:hypothetical protein